MTEILTPPQKASSTPNKYCIVDLPDIPQKRYFTIGEVARLCAVKTYVLRYWERIFHGHLNPTKRKGNRRYYRHQDIHLDPYNQAT